MSQQRVTGDADGIDRGASKLQTVTSDVGTFATTVHTEGGHVVSLVQQAGSTAAVAAAACARLNDVLYRVITDTQKTCEGLTETAKTNSESFRKVGDSGADTPKVREAMATLQADDKTVVNSLYERPGSGYDPAEIRKHLHNALQLAHQIPSREARKLDDEISVLGNDLDQAEARDHIPWGGY